MCNITELCTHMCLSPTPDLSFNNIKVIRGLERLVRLKDLSLAHNLIEHVSGLECLQQLQVLSLGHNLLANMKDTVGYLRQRSTLQSLCLRGNKFSPVPAHPGDTEAVREVENYQKYCLAFLPSVIYLDYQMITEEAVSMIIIKVQCCTVSLDIFAWNNIFACFRRRAETTKIRSRELFLHIALTTALPFNCKIYFLNNITNTSITEDCDSQLAPE